MVKHIKNTVVRHKHTKNKTKNGTNIKCKLNFLHFICSLVRTCIKFNIGMFDHDIKIPKNVLI